MIIRILGEGQYLLDDALLSRVNEIDNRIVRDITSGSQGDFSRDLADLIKSVKSLAKPLDPAEILPSDIIIPPPDISFEEAKRVFRGEGLIKG